MINHNCDNHPQRDSDHCLCQACLDELIEDAKKAGAEEEIEKHND